MNFLLMYRSTPHATTNEFPCFLFLNRQIGTRLDLLHPDTETKVSTKQEAQKRYHDTHARHRELLIGQRVLVRSSPPGLQWVPYVVKVADSKRWRRHIDHIRGMPDSSQHTPPETILESLDPELPLSPNLPVVKPPVSTDISINPDPPNSPKQPTQSESQPESQSPAPTSKTSTPQHRYPTRMCKPPERLTYYSM